MRVCTTLSLPGDKIKSRPLSRTNYILCNFLQGFSFTFKLVKLSSISNSLARIAVFLRFTDRPLLLLPRVVDKLFFFPYW